MTEQTHDFVDFWAVHSEREGKPGVRAVARSEAEAKAKLGAVREADAGDAETTEYWVTRLTRGQLESLSSLGLVPSSNAESR